MRHIADTVHDSHLVVLPDCGHFAYLERPDPTFTAITAFLNRST